MDLDTLVKVLAAVGVYAALFGFLGHYVAERCRGNTTEGMILGAVFGPLGVILVALMPNDRT